MKYRIVKRWVKWCKGFRYYPEIKRYLFWQSLDTFGNSILPSVLTNEGFLVYYKNEKNAQDAIIKFSKFYILHKAKQDERKKSKIVKNGDIETEFFISSL